MILSWFTATKCTLLDIMPLYIKSHDTTHYLEGSRTSACALDVLRDGPICQVTMPRDPIKHSVQLAWYILQPDAWVSLMTQLE